LRSTLLKKKDVESKATIQLFATKNFMAGDSNEEETGSQRIRQTVRNKGSNGFYKRGAYRATTRIRAVCNETFQSSLTAFTNTELDIKVIGSQERQMQ
jgi:hypothetical protein